LTRLTVAQETKLEGPGLHLGERCRLTFKPAPAGQGVIFVRADLPDSAPIPALVSHVSASERRTQLGMGAASVHTVEHVLAAVSALGIDDLTIAMDAPEPPILDGSARPFFEALERAGLAALEGQPDYLTLLEPVRIIDGESVYEAYPAPSLELDVTIDFEHPKIGRQSSQVGITRETFGSDIAGARTFGFLKEVEWLRDRGLIKGASLDNTVVLDQSTVLSGPLRWHDEFVRHKMLDCVGDLALAGAHVQARIVALKPSHRGTVTLVRELLRTGVRRNGNGASGVKANQEEWRKPVYDIEGIMKVLPHRYPFLLVDRIIELEENKRIVGIKNVTINEPFFAGHFPGHPVMPGVLIVEAMAQVGGMLLMGSVKDANSKVVYFMSLDKVKFRRPVKPGDQIRFELDVIQIRGMVCRMRGVGKVDGEIVVEAEMAAMVRDR